MQLAILLKKTYIVLNINNISKAFMLLDMTQDYVNNSKISFAYSYVEKCVTIL